MNPVGPFAGAGRGLALVVLLVGSSACFPVLPDAAIAPSPDMTIDATGSERTDGDSSDTAPVDVSEFDVGRDDLGVHPDASGLDRGVGLDSTTFVDGAALDSGLPDLADRPDQGWAPDLGGPGSDVGASGLESCNGLDDDSDGIVDEDRACGRVVESRCRVYLGWADNNAAPEEGSASWSSCPGTDEENFGGDDRACRGTRRDGNFRLLGMPFLGNADDDDSIGLAFICDGEPDEVTAWIQDSCTIWMGHTDNGLAAAREVWDDWGGCVARSGTGEPPEVGWRCLSTSGDGLFHRLDLVGDVAADDHFGVAFRCRDDDDPARAAAVQASAAVVFGWSDWDLNGGIGDGGATWGGCPGADRAGRDNEGVVRCASSAFDGRFHHFNTASDVTDLHAFGIALMSHPDAP